MLKGVWDVLQKDIKEFVDVVAGDTKEVLDKVLQKDEEVCICMLSMQRHIQLSKGSMYDDDNVLYVYVHRVM